MFINSMSELVNYLSEVNDVNGTMRDIDISAFWLMARVEVFGGTVVLDCEDYGGHHVILFSEERHYPDTIDQNRYCVAQVTHDGYLANFEKGSFNECFDCLIGWTRTEVADIA